VQRVFHSTTALSTRPGRQVIHHHRWDIQRVGQERVQEPHCAELQPEAQPVVITAPPRD
jgi:hypothetical protein